MSQLFLFFPLRRTPDEPQYAVNSSRRSCLQGRWNTGWRSGRWYSQMSNRTRCGYEKCKQYNKSSEIPLHVPVVMLPRSSINFDNIIVTLLYFSNILWISFNTMSLTQLIIMSDKLLRAWHWKGNTALIRLSKVGWPCNSRAFASTSKVRRHRFDQNGDTIANCLWRKSCFQISRPPPGGKGQGK